MQKFLNYEVKHKELMILDNKVEELKKQIEGQVKLQGKLLEEAKQLMRKAQEVVQPIEAQHTEVLGKIKKAVQQLEKLKTELIKIQAVQNYINEEDKPNRI